MTTDRTEEYYLAQMLASVVFASSQNRDRLGLDALDRPQVLTHLAEVLGVDLSDQNRERYVTLCAHLLLAKLTSVQQAMSDMQEALTPPSPSAAQEPTGATETPASESRPVMGRTGASGRTLVDAVALERLLNQVSDASLWLITYRGSEVRRLGESAVRRLGGRLAQELERFGDGRGR